MRSKMILKAVNAKSLPAESIKSVQLIGTDQSLKWVPKPEGLANQMPDHQPDYDYAFPVRIQLNNPMNIDN